VNIFSPDLPPGLPEMPFLNAIASTSYFIGGNNISQSAPCMRSEAPDLLDRFTPPILEASHRCTRPRRYSRRIRADFVAESIAYLYRERGADARLQDQRRWPIAPVMACRQLQRERSPSAGNPRSLSFAHSFLPVVANNTPRALKLSGQSGPNRPAPLSQSNDGSCMAET
jgi:hypothetical protein